ncbi:MAG: DNA translocase FtsK 4TM domain-containing protein [Coriobacteriaceae bacterium]|nr:DNA translocase FtsK 4TM domain-containing protein [Coriobacteriaceae bacterium]
MGNDIIGVVLIIIAVVLFACVVAPGAAVVSSAVSFGMRAAFGIGAFILPFAILIWGISFFVRSESTHVGRIVLGLALIVFAIMALLSLYSQTVYVDDPDTLFAETTLTDGGGYVGSGVGYALMSLFGRGISTIILIGIILIGAILFGLSITAAVTYIRDSISASMHKGQRPKKGKQAAADADDEDFEVGVKRGRQQTFSAVDDADYLPQSDETLMLGNQNKKDIDMPPDATETVDLSAADTELYIDPDLSSYADEEAAGMDAAAETIALVDTEGEQEAPADTGTKRRGATVTKKLRTPSDASEPVGTTPSALDGFELPPMQLLHVSRKRKGAGANELRQTATLLKQTLEEFKVPAEVVGWLTGPTVTMFKVELPSGVKLSKLTSLQDDIALALAAPSVRIAQIPDTSLVGVEIPNKTRSNVLLGDVLKAAEPGPLQLAIGEDVDGQNICVDLAKMPHLLIGGTTGSGKSVSINSMIMSILMRTTPAEVRMIMIDPKRVELSLYNGIPHLYVPVVTEPKEAASALKWGVVEMERRLKVFEQAGARNIGLYNQMIQEGRLDDEEGNRPAELPYIVIIIDELSDLMMVAGKEVEDSICRIAQLARAAGIHLIVATQRPSSNVVTGMIKANITNRIAFNVATSVDSRVILDQSGAEKLVGLGDMLFSKPEWGKPKRIQGCYVDESETEAVVEHLKKQGEPDYHPEILQTQLDTHGGGSGAAGGGGEDDDPLIWEAAEAVVNAGLGSTSMLQRRLKVGYARAGRIMDMLEAKGVVGPQDGSKAREVLIEDLDDLAMIRAADDADEEGF